MKNKIFKLVSIIVHLTLLISFIGCENKNNEKVTNEKVNSESENVSKEKEINYEEEYYSYIKNDLIPKYGLSNINSTQGIMKTMYDNWFNPSGILSAKIYDFDNDGIKELFLIRIEEATEKSSVYNNQCSEYYFYGEIHKFINNTITLIDKTLIKSYDNFETDEYIAFKFMSNQYCIDDLFINIVPVDNRNYILFEFKSYPGAFATGEGYYACWALEYKQEKLNMVFGISGTGLDCGYVTGYTFDSGNLNSKVLLYSEMDETKNEDYKSFNEAIKGFLGKFNISTKDCTDYRTIEESILSDENKIEKILEYHIKRINNNSNQFIFETETRDFTNLREHCNKELNENETKTTEIYNESNSENKYYEYIDKDNKDMINSKYAELLNDIHDNPTKYVKNMNSKYDNIEDNDFAIVDINQDGINELVVSFTNTAVANMYTGIWAFDSNSKSVIEYANIGATCEYFSNGIIKVLSSHNQSYGETIWPYDLVKYDENSKEYVFFAGASCVDSRLDTSGKFYSTEKDLDNDGVIYYFTVNGEESKPLTLEEYSELVKKYIPEEKKIEIEWYKLTNENINKFIKGKTN